VENSGAVPGTGQGDPDGKHYDKDVFNGDIGQIVKIDLVEREVTIRSTSVTWFTILANWMKCVAYVVTVHKSRSEFPVVVIPWHAALPAVAAESGLHRGDAGRKLSC